MSESNSEFTIALKPVYSEPAGSLPANVSLPSDWSLMWHQAETLQALRDPNLEVIVNTAMTGDGKSFAAYSGVLFDRSYALGLYPTNELARDQTQQLADYVQRFQPPHEPRVDRLSGPELELLAAGENLTKAAAIASRSENAEILLANPDIIHYLHRGAYLKPKDNPDKLWNRVDKAFETFIFDEFHVFAPPQVASVLNTMLLIRATNRQKKFLFLSATPDNQLIDQLDRAGFRYRCIDPGRRGKYAFPDTASEVQGLQAQGWRQVAREIELTFVALESSSGSSERWLREQTERILQLFRAQPGSKGAIILNSIAAVKRLVPWFQGQFASAGLTVGENTGLSGQQTKLASLQADLVIGTSTIDVGVDFKINLLWFESADAGSFVQRLGRLGRHDGYERDGNKITFERYQAYALVPNYLAERLFLREPAALVAGDRYPRPDLVEAVKTTYRDINDFRGYYRRWGAVQSFRLICDLNSPEIRQNYAASRDRLQRECQQVFQTSFGKVYGCIKGWARDWQALSGKKNNPIFEEAASFRGTSPLLCGLYDETEPHDLDRFKTYDLPGILSNLAAEVWTEAGFLRELQATSDRLGEPIAKGRFRHCLGFLKLKGYRPERLFWRFHYPGRWQPLAEAYRVQVLVGLEVWQPENPWVAQLNARLRSRAVVCYPIASPVAAVRQRLQLPMHFALYPVADETSVQETAPPFAIAIGQAALLVDTLAARLRSQGGEIWVV